MNMKQSEQQIDQIFHGQLEGYTLSPPPGTLENIRARLKNRKRKQRIVLLRAIAAAAVMILAMVAGWMLYDFPESQQEMSENRTEKDFPAATEPVSRDNKKDGTKKEISGSGLSDNKLAPAEPFAEMKTKPMGPEAQHTESFALIQTASLHRNAEQLPFMQSVKPFIKSPAVSWKLHRKERDSSLGRTLSVEDQKLLAFNRATIADRHSEEDRWGLGLRVAPGYSSQNASHAADYSRNMTYSNTEGTADLNAGISVSYKASRRLSVESGMYYAQNGQKSGNSLQYSSNRYETLNTMYAVAADYFNTPVDIKQGKILMNSSAGVIEFSETPENAELSANLDTKSELPNALLTNSEFHQVFDFIEIPVLLRYTFIDKKIAMDMVGGVSANWVVGNKVYIGEGSDKEYVGHTADISDMNYSGTLGLALDYALGKKLSVCVEPRINYFLNSLNKNKAVDYRPYRIGLYTGINYSF